MDIGPLQVANRSIGPLQPAGTTALTENLADSITLSEALGLGFGDVFSDNATLSDTPVVVLGLGYSFSDSFTINDASFQVTLNLPEVVSDSFSFSDAATYALAVDPFIQFSVADSFTVVDAAPAVYYDTPVFDNLDFEDSIQVALVGVRFISVFDAFALADLIQNTPIPIPINLFVSDTLLFSEYQIYDNYAFGDQLFFSDAILVWSGSLQQNDSFAFVDNLLELDVGVVEPLADSFSLSDAIVPLLTIPESVGDHVLFTDGLAFALPISVDPSTQSPPSIDNILFTDSILLALSSLAFGDQIILVDSTNLLYGSGITQIDSIVLADAMNVALVSTVVNLSQTKVDILSFSDGIGLGLLGLLSGTPSDTVSFSDNLTLLVTNTFFAATEAVGDSFILSDSSSLELVGLEVISSSDMVSFSENLQLNLGLILSDSVSLTDSMNEALRENAASINDGIVFSDSVTISGLAVQLTITVSETLSLSDVVNGGAPIVVDTSYIRRYLNDVLVKG